MTLSEPQTGFDSWAQNVGQLRDLQRLADAEKGPETNGRSRQSIFLHMDKIICNFVTTRVFYKAIEMYY